MSNDNSERETELVLAASSWCANHGVMMGARDAETRKPLGDFIYEPAPFSLYPTPFPKTAFDKAYDLMTHFSAMTHKGASSWDWLSSTIRVAAEADGDFTGKLLKLAEEVVEREAFLGTSRAQRVTLAVLRSDYMLHADGSETRPEKAFKNAIPLQVELNTIASSFGCLSTKISKMHKDITWHNPAEFSFLGSLPENNAATGIVQGIAMALQEYKRQRSEQTQDGVDSLKLHPVVCVMIVQPGETNSCDQRDLQFLLQQQHGMRIVRKTLYEMAQCNYEGISFEGRELIVMDGKEKVAAGVVYYRAGYTPEDYQSQVEWKGRGIIEHSAAIKCPDVFYHLVGAKKVQQALAQPGVLRQFCTSDEQERLLSSCFAGLHALGEGDDSKIVQEAISNPSAFVLKPQREGGGNNIYDDDLVKALQTLSYEERGAYILMQKILPPATQGYLVRRGQVVFQGDCVSELGVFGVTLREYGTPEKEGKILLDSVPGHILRTKTKETDEGGVAAGYAFLSSPVVT